jgi:hypothetical protein
VRRTSDIVAIKPRISHETVGELVSAATRASAGDVTGVSMIVYGPRMSYHVIHAGVATEHPEFAIGAICRMLSDLMGDQRKKEAGQ